MPRDAVFTDQTAPAPGPFSAAVRSHGMTFLSGVVAEDRATGAFLLGAAVEIDAVAG